MFPVGQFDAAGENKSRVTQQAQRVDHRRDRLQQIPVMRGGIERLMQVAVENHKPFGILLGTRLGCDDLEQALYLGFARMISK